VTFATLHTTLGPIRVELFDNHAPKTVRNFIGLAEGTTEYTNPVTNQPGSGPYYDGVLFEVRSAALGPDQPVAAGGRYDALPQRLGARVKTGAVGCMVRPGRAYAGKRR